MAGFLNSRTGRALVADNQGESRFKWWSKELLMLVVCVVGYTQWGMNNWPAGNSVNYGLDVTMLVVVIIFTLVLLYDLIKAVMPKKKQ